MGGFASRLRGLGKEQWGQILIIVGVAAWLPYFLLKYGLNKEVIVSPFLVVHLSGVIPGFLLKKGRAVSQWLEKR